MVGMAGMVGGMVGVVGGFCVGCTKKVGGWRRGREGEGGSLVGSVDRGWEKGAYEVTARQAKQALLSLLPSPQLPKHQPNQRTDSMGKLRADWQIEGFGE